MEMTEEKILGEQLIEVLKTGESREAHRLSRIIAGRGMGTRRRHLSRQTEKRQSPEERAKTREQPVEKGGCSGLRIIFGDEVQKMKENSEPIVLDHNAMQQGHRDWTCLQVAVWRPRHWRAPVPWSIPAELLEILIFPSGGADKPH